MLALEKDHSYCPKELTVKEPVNSVTSSTPKTKRKIEYTEYEEECESSFDDFHLDDLDRSYQPESDDGESDSESDNESDIVENGNNTIAEERKFIVFESSLDKLIHMGRCLDCNSAVLNVTKTVIGTMLKIRTECINGHEIINWTSQPITGSKMPAGNLLCAAAILFSGQNYRSTAKFIELMNIPFIGPTTYYKCQKDILIPVVNHFWAKEREEIYHELRCRGNVQLAGDGRCDSPGFCAKYCTYTFMDVHTGKVVDFEIKQVTQTGTSQSMEKAGFEETLDRIIDNGVEVTAISTDRHTGIKKIMKEKYKEVGIDHQFDPFHVANWVRKQLHAKTKYKKYSALAPWVKAVVNHIWWSARTCGGDPKMLEERWVSVMNHVVNEHEWADSEVFHKCEHRYDIFQKCN